MFGFIKHSLVDYPGEVCSVIFFPHCNFSCPYCHNQDLLEGKIESPWSQEDILEYLKRAAPVFISAVCITGGEPTLHPDKLFSLINELKKLNIKVKLDTNGSNPEILKRIKVDYIAMDLKTSLDNYSKISQDSNISSKIGKSIEIIQNNFCHHFRTTLYPPLTTDKDLREIKVLSGSSKLILQKYIPQK